MSKSSAAKKAARKSERKKLRNKAILSATKTHITRVEKLVESNDTEGARKEAVVAISALDRTAKQKVMHPNTAARRKSRLMKKLNKTGAAPAAAATKPAASKAKAKKT